MKSESFFLVMCGIFISTGALSSSYHWQYGEEANWPSTCLYGTAQSPINLDDSVAVQKSYKKFVFNHYNVDVPATVKNNGHSVQVLLDPSVPPPTITGGGLPKEYVLDHLHFHWDSEHTLNGHRFPLEVHLVHYALDYKNIANATNHADGIAVLAVFCDISPDEDEELEPVLQVIKTVERMPESVSPANNTRVNTFLPRDTAGFYRYRGSLTTPNCSESVIWTIFTNTIHISEEQAVEFQSVYSDDGALMSNYRTLQPLNNRVLYHKLSPIPYAAVSSSLWSRSLLYTLSGMVVLLCKL